MIGRLTGTIADQGLDGSIILDIAGVGYELFVPQRSLGIPDQEKTFHVHTHVREDSLTLFGFETSEDRVAFRALLGVSNVGPKSALAILGSMDAHQLANAIAREDKNALKGIPGVGKKTIERIFLDLQGKLIASAGAKAVRPAVRVPQKTLAQGPSAAVIGALVQMGYRRNEAERAVSALEPEEGKSVEELLRHALGALS